MERLPVYMLINGPGWAASFTVYDRSEAVRCAELTGPDVSKCSPCRIEVLLSLRTILGQGQLYAQLLAPAWQQY